MHYQVQAIATVYRFPGYLGQIRPVLALTVLSRSAKELQFRIIVYAFSITIPSVGHDLSLVLCIFMFLHLLFGCFVPPFDPATFLK